jgi:hypothetical protein
VILFSSIALFCGIPYAAPYSAEDLLYACSMEGYVRNWHLSDMADLTNEVRSWGVKRTCSLRSPNFRGLPMVANPPPRKHRFAKRLVAAYISKNMEGKLCG